MTAPKLIDIGEYAADRRLITRDAHRALFWGGRRAVPAVYVQPDGDVFYAYRFRSTMRGGGQVELPPTVTARRPTAAEALARIIGPVTR